MKTSNNSPVNLELLDRNMERSGSTRASLAAIKGLIAGLDKEHRIEWGCARQAQLDGAQAVFLCLNAKAYDHVAPLAGSLNAPLKTCYVETPSDLQDLVEGAVAHLGQLEFSMHPIAREPLEKPHGDAVNSSLAGYARAKEVSSKSFAPLVQPRLPHLAQVGSLVTMSYQDTVEAVPYYGLMESILTWAASNIKDFDALMSHAHAKSPLEVIERSTQPYPAL